MSDLGVPEGEIQIIRSAILDFINEMKQDKRNVEQQILERTQSISSNLLNSGASQFSYQEMEGLSRQYREEFINIYRNTVHLKIVASASSKIRETIHKGLIDANVIQHEWLEGFKSLQDQINHYQSVVDKADALETELQGRMATETEFGKLQTLLDEQEQLIREKDQEIMNLTEGLTRMENQANNMGQSMLENSMTIEELQTALNDRDIEISRLKQELTSSQSSSTELEQLQQQLRDAQQRERELSQQADNVSTDLMDQLQEDLNTTREQVLELRRELVQKNEEVHALKLDQDEFSVKTKQLEDKISEIKEEKSGLESDKNQLEHQLSTLNAEQENINQELSNKDSELSAISEELTSTKGTLDNIRNELANYEGKVAMSVEEQDKIKSELANLQSNLTDYEKVVTYLKHALKSDLKFQMIILLATKQEELRVDDLANALNSPVELIQRAVIELSEDKLLEVRREGRNMFCKQSIAEEPPLLLVN